MTILIVTPAPPGSRKGNRVTALRWAAIFRKLSHRVRVVTTYRGENCDILIALHARKSLRSILHYRCERPTAPLVVALTGTDLYHDLRRSAGARRALDLASRIVLLQPKGIDELAPAVRHKARVIFQSARAVRGIRRQVRAFDVCVLGHLRSVKDPFRAALAVRRIQKSSRIRLLQIGAALDPAMARRAGREMKANPRYCWLGELSRPRALRVLASCQLLVLTSRLEGGANVISEAIACDVPVIASRIAGATGILGDDYPGLFPVGNTAALARLLSRAESDRQFCQKLRNACRARRPLIRPAREKSSWRSLLRELAVR